MMHAVKGGWVGQTFALARHNESEGRKSRIRRSKEERKAMVESFIKKYQSSNNGSFPSLNLTHKEVGGSFYTVREIVREIIQENRVLGPANSSEEELNADQFYRQYPLATIATEPETSLDITSKGSPFVFTQHQGRNEEQVSLSDGLAGEQGNQMFNDKQIVSGSQVDCNEHENQTLDKEQIINGSQADVRIEESAKSSWEKLQTSDLLEIEKQVENLAASTVKVTPITAEVIVETFPLRPVPKTADYSDERLVVKKMTETLEINEIEEVDLESGDHSAPIHEKNSSDNSGLEDGQKEKTPVGAVLDRNSLLLDDKAVEKFADPQLTLSDYSTTEVGTVHDNMVGRDVEVEVSCNDVLTSKMYEENQGTDGKNEINAQNGKIHNGTYGSSSRQESRTPKVNLIENDLDVQHKESVEKGNNPTIERIKFESWERASRNPSETESNPLSAIFKSFITAFMKFWSE